MDLIVTRGLGRLTLLAALFPRQIQSAPTPAPVPRLSRAELSGLFADELGYR